MKYVSTRGTAPVLEFEDVLLAGLARDGGLYVPESWPQFSAEEIAGFAGKPYAEVAARVMAPFVGDAITAETLESMTAEAYATFSHRAVTPLSQLAPGHFLLELFHGPTLAFKDVAMQMLGRLFDHALTRRGGRATIVCATSGDTGGAAVEAFRGRERTDLFILLPKGRVSPVQRRQMTTVDDPSVHALEIEGTFDDCQALVKAMFNDQQFRDELALGGVNSINWARVMSQAVYYFVAAVALGGPHRPVAFTVPTGNFGDILAGHVAACMGLPVAKLVIATNVNDILQRTLASGRYAVGDVIATTSPSMDIQVSSNFERLLFEAYGRDGEAVRRSMDGLAQSGAFTISEKQLQFIRAEFAAERVDESETSGTIACVLRETGMLIDPHTAVGIAAGDRQDWGDATPMVTLSTAHPAKFPDAVIKASGLTPQLPPHLADLMERPERSTTLPNDLAEVQAFVKTRSRAAAATA